MSIVTEKEVNDYTPWYRLAQEVLGTLIPSLNDNEIKDVSPKRADWFAIPLPSESSVGEVANRPDPHIDFRLLDNGTRIRIGIRCNTVTSVDKLENILTSFHNQEKADLISEMRKLDGDFKTQVIAKIKETNFAHVDGYETKYEIVSNSIDENTIARMFDVAGTIRKEGIVRMKAEGRNLNPETPVIDLCYVTTDAEPSVFKKKLLQMNRMYEICLSVKTRTELGEELRKRREDFDTKYVCAKCGKEFQTGSMRSLRFCDQDGMRIIVRKVPRRP